MRKEVFRTYDAAGRAIAFCHEHPDPNPIAGTAVTTLETLTGKMGSLLEQFEAGMRGAGTSVVGKARLRKEIRGQLEDLQRFADIAAVRRPEQALVFSLPPRSVNQKSYLAIARSILAVVGAHRELLLTYGMPETLPERIAERLNQYESVEVQKSVSEQRHVGASAEMVAVRSQMSIAIRHLDALQRVRFADNAELLAAWRNARDEHGPIRPVSPAHRVKPADARPAA